MAGSNQRLRAAFWRLVASIGVVAATHATAAAPTAAGRDTSWGSFYVAYTSSPDPIPLGQLFSMTVTVSDATDHAKRIEDSTIAVDAQMPAHHHGMNLQPRVAPVGPGSFTVDGMLFHMPGPWQIRVDVTRNGTTERAVFDVTVE